MASFAESYSIEGQPEGGETRRVCTVPTFVVLDRTRPIILHGACSIKVPTGTDHIILSVTGSGPADPLGASSGLIVPVDPGGGTFQRVDLDAIQPPGFLGAYAASLFVQCVNATDPSLVSFVLLEARYDCDPPLASTSA